VLRETRLKAQRRYKAGVRRVYRQLNLCPQCGKEKDNGYKLCAECREYARSYYKRKRKLVVIKARMGWGYAMKAHRYYYCSELRALHLPPLNRGRRIALWGWLRARYASRKKEKMKQVCNK
jgi:hypothetical protein